MNQLDALGGGFVAVRGVNDLEAGDIETVPAGGVLDLVFGTDQDRPDNAGLALSTAPRSEVSSQGCTTMVGVGGTALAAAINRSYLLPVGFASRRRT